MNARRRQKTLMHTADVLIFLHFCASYHGPFMRPAGLKKAERANGNAAPGSFFCGIPFAVWQTPFFRGNVQAGSGIFLFGKGIHFSDALEVLFQPQ